MTKSLPLLPTYRADLIARRGRVWRPGETRSETITLPFLIPGTTVRLEPDGIARSAEAAVPAVVDLVRRIAPWVTVYVAPRLFCHADKEDRLPAFFEAEGEEWQSYCGAYTRGLALVSIAIKSPQVMLQSACHEAWHAIEDRLSGDWKALVDADLEPLLYGEGNPYWSDPEERRARAFEAWCGRFLEGLPPFTGTTTLDEIFGMAWSGLLGSKLLQPHEGEFA